MQITGSEGRSGQIGNTGMTRKGIERTIRALTTRAANYVERAKDDPTNADHWLGLAYSADARANEWRLELKALPQEEARKG